MAQEEWARQQEMSKIMKETADSFHKMEIRPKAEMDAIPPDEEEKAGIDECLVSAAHKYSGELARWDMEGGFSDPLTILFSMPDDEPGEMRYSVSIELDAEQAMHLSEALRLHAEMMLFERRTRKDYSAG
jgi:hypothetical protein